MALYITIDSTKIDSDLTNYPIGIIITSSDSILSGLGATDYEGFHFTVSSIECYAEVDIWDMVNEIAIIWVQVPTVSSSSDTVITITNIGDDNTAYVGSTGSTPAQAVWDSSYSLVLHMSQDPSGGAGSILDSTSNGLDMTPGGTMTSGDLVDSGFGKALDFDGSNDNLTRADNTLLDITASDSFTIEAYFNCSTTGRNDCLTDKRLASGVGYILGVKTTTNYANFYLRDGPNIIDNLGTTALTRDGTTYYLVVGRLDRSTNLSSLFLNDSKDSTDLSTSTLGDCNNTNSLYVADNSVTSTWTNFLGKISEYRISKTARSDAWIKANYYNLSGLLLSKSTTPPGAEPNYSYGKISINGKYVNILSISLIEKGQWRSVDDVYMLNDGDWRLNIKTEI